MGASKMAMSSARVIATCAVGGQAMGTAAAVAIKHDCDPAEVAAEHITEVQQQLLYDDCYLPGLKENDPANLARTAVITASSEVPGCEVQNLVSGITRTENGKNHVWQSLPLTDGAQFVTFKLDESHEIKQVQIVFDPDLSRPLKITMSPKRQAEQLIGTPPELVKDYNVVLYKDGCEVARQEIRGNYQRLNRISFENMPADEVKVEVLATNGIEAARIYEVRLY